MSPNDNYRPYGGVGGVSPESYSNVAGVRDIPATISSATTITDIVGNIQKDLTNMEDLLDALTNRLMPVLNMSPVCQSDDMYPVTSNSPVASDLISIHQRIANVIKRMHDLRSDIQL